jgi:hypothetical protein
MTPGTLRGIWRLLIGIQGHRKHNQPIDWNATNGAALPHNEKFA